MCRSKISIKFTAGYETYEQHTEEEIQKKSLGRLGCILEDKDSLNVSSHSSI